MQNQAFIGRQPIVDLQQKIIGYELLFRHSAEASSAEITDDLQAGTNVLVNTFSNMDANWLLGDKLAFINIAAPMLESNFLELLPVKRVVLELIETVEATPELLARIHALRHQGGHFVELFVAAYGAADDLELLVEQPRQVELHRRAGRAATHD